MLNEKGGINGRKVKLLTMDDAYSAPKCVEATRRLVEHEACWRCSVVGTAPQTAVQKYLNSKGVPQLLLTPAPRNGTIRRTSNGPWRACRCTRPKADSRQICAGREPNAKVGILYQNDDFGRDFLAPFKKVLADAGGTPRSSWS